MKILTHVQNIRKQVRSYGNCRILAEQSGVTYSWLTKFSDGRITNPTVAKIAQLEQYFAAAGHHATAGPVKQSGKTLRGKK